MEYAGNAPTALPISRVRYFGTPFARLEGNWRGRVACSVHPGDLIAGAARVQHFNEIDSPEREKKGEAWRDSVEAQLRGYVRDFNQPHDFEIQAVRVDCGGIGNRVDGRRHH